MHTFAVPVNTAYGPKTSIYVLVYSLNGLLYSGAGRLLFMCYINMIVSDAARFEFLVMVFWGIS